MEGQKDASTKQYPAREGNIKFPLIVVSGKWQEKWSIYQKKQTISYMANPRRNSCNRTISISTTKIRKCWKKWRRLRHCRQLWTVHNNIRKKRGRGRVFHCNIAELCQHHRQVAAKWRNGQQERKPLTFTVCLNPTNLAPPLWTESCHVMMLSLMLLTTSLNENEKWVQCRTELDWTIFVNLVKPQDVVGGVAASPVVVLIVLSSLASLPTARKKWCCYCTYIHTSSCSLFYGVAVYVVVPIMLMLMLMAM